MKYSTHLALGAYLGAMTTIVVAPTPASSVAFMGATLLGSLLPDVDHPESWLGKRIRFISVPLSELVGHRGITHSLLGITLVLLMTLLSNYAVPSLMPVANGVMIGYISHVAGDWLTPSGISLLWPDKKRYACAINFDIGSIHEWLLMAVLAAAAVVIYVAYLYRMTG